MVLFVIGLVAVGGMAFYRAQHAAGADPGGPLEIRVSHHLLRQSIREEFQTGFAPVEETTVERLPGDKVRVSGWVDLVTKEGRSSRQNYSIVIFRDAGGDWVGENISILPQM